MLIYLILISLVKGNWHDALEEDNFEASTCGKYQCAPSTATVPSGYCGTVTNVNVFNLKACPTSGTSTFCNTTTLQCTAAPASSALASYPGEPCTSQSDCKYGTCTSKKCVGVAKNGKCTTHAQCAPGLRCAPGGTCTAQLAIGTTGCRDYQDCVNWAGCNATYTSTNGTCTSYATLSNGAVVTDCVNGWSHLCKSGFCSNTQSWYGNIGICQSAPTSVKTLPVSCTQDTDCVGTDGTNFYLGQCTCGYNSAGTSYCSSFIGDAPGVLLIQTWLKTLKLTTSCNTGRRASSACMSLIGKTTLMKQVNFGFAHYPLTINNDACIKSIYTPAYWGLSLSEEFDTFE
ncbi:unnamed protein product [Blepharisma stoltei]|uniref:Antifreeze protein n=1 Tax=Blepharisma stoltei TaxID=1481888 RepID=A0AAU9IMW2_9CILI|nr:unnamed protein product [Blepharisma stoltei]